MSEKQTKKLREVIGKASAAAAKEAVEKERMRIVELTHDMEEDLEDKVEGKLILNAAEAHVLRIRVEIASALLAQLRLAIMHNIQPRAWKPKRNGDPCV